MSRSRAVISPCSRYASSKRLVSLCFSVKLGFRLVCSNVLAAPGALIPRGLGPVSAPRSRARRRVAVPVRAPVGVLVNGSPRIMPAIPLRVPTGLARRSSWFRPLRSVSAIVTARAFRPAAPTGLAVLALAVTFTLSLAGTSLGAAANQTQAHELDALSWVLGRDMASRAVRGLFGSSNAASAPTDTSPARSTASTVHGPRRRCGASRGPTAFCPMAWPAR